MVLECLLVLQGFHSSCSSGRFRNSHDVWLQLPGKRRALARAGADVLLSAEQASLELSVDLDKNCPTLNCIIPTAFFFFKCNMENVKYLLLRNTEVFAESP